MSLEIRLEETALEPGSELRGRVDWRAGGNAVDSVVISLLWYTEGKGTEDVEIEYRVAGGDQVAWITLSFTYLSSHGADDTRIPPVFSTHVQLGLHLLYLCASEGTAYVCVAELVFR